MSAPVAHNASTGSGKQFGWLCSFEKYALLAIHNYTGYALQCAVTGFLLAQVVTTLLPTHRNLLHMGSVFSLLLLLHLPKLNWLSFHLHVMTLFPSVSPPLFCALLSPLHTGAGASL